MKKVAFFLTTLFILYFHSTSIHSQNTKQLIQLEGTRQQLLLNLFKEKIRNATTTYYTTCYLKIDTFAFNTVSSMEATFIEKALIPISFHDDYNISLKTSSETKSLYT